MMLVRLLMMVWKWLSEMTVLFLQAVTPSTSLYKTSRHPLGVSLWTAICHPLPAQFSACEISKLSFPPTWPVFGFWGASSQTPHTPFGNTLKLEKHQLGGLPLAIIFSSYSEDSKWLCISGYSRTSGSGQSLSISANQRLLARENRGQWQPHLKMALLHKSVNFMFFSGSPSSQIPNKINDTEASPGIWPVTNPGYVLALMCFLNTRTQSFVDKFNAHF